MKNWMKKSKVGKNSVIALSSLKEKTVSRFLFRNPRNPRTSSCLRWGFHQGKKIDCLDDRWAHSKSQKVLGWSSIRRWIKKSITSSPESKSSLRILFNFQRMLLNYLFNFLFESVRWGRSWNRWSRFSWTSGRIFEHGNGFGNRFEYRSTLRFSSNLCHTFAVLSH